ncbi:Coatomer/calthrin adaptor appendage C-terminal subdomain [Arabidopsis thaliana x Arabidopsis arenosa]|uniref:Coatomer/calthrin adaptor appendage C-terminal subdomain n=2 Tax=Arabidopsis TaxID=3701 RepID=A0A8T2FY71_ARASU|nr:Coatomer/calthrin adaptor appendage C-terminal subdomain [Arabidopsis thaliana x Arabidopsis arenosa]KAG7640948.1 Coatomer/calthrin adaptor appendage C-terminal subdomain [Arabidopsis suecica]
MDLYKTLELKELSCTSLLKGTETVASNARSHTCLLSGLYIGNVKVLVKAQFGMDSSKEIVMKLAVRAEDPSVSDAIHALVANG